MNMKKVIAAFTSLLGFVAIAPYELEHLGTIVPPEWKARVAIAAAAATFVLRIISNKQP